MPPEHVIVLNDRLFRSVPLIRMRASLTDRGFPRVRVRVLDYEAPLYTELPDRDVCAAARAVLTSLGKIHSEAEVFPVVPSTLAPEAPLPASTRFITKRLALSTDAMAREAYACMALAASPQVATPDFLVVTGATACLAFLRESDATNALLNTPPGRAALRGQAARLEADLRTAVSGMLARGLVYNDWKAANVVYDAERGFRVIDFGNMLHVSQLPAHERSVEYMLRKAYADPRMEPLISAVSAV